MNFLSGGGQWPEPRRKHHSLSQWKGNPWLFPSWEKLYCLHIIDPLNASLLPSSPWDWNISRISIQLVPGRKMTSVQYSFTFFFQSWKYRDVMRATMSLADSGCRMFKKNSPLKEWVGTCSLSGEISSGNDCHMWLFFVVSCFKGYYCRPLIYG